ncbi:unnamed protein product [Cylicocyclus nassatus]|uniref:Uncharacterized protein n=1 Tax=Cylicocyclus nassatus TaxID=53992 RepID=A0AA36DRR0_CYLNA|nr:unnamed protein product [Cylicocyclus nassatus]
MVCVIQTNVYKYLCFVVVSSSYTQISEVLSNSNATDVQGNSGLGDFAGKDNGYCRGMQRSFFKKNIFDFASPEFNNIGWQDVLNGELFCDGFNDKEEYSNLGYNTDYKSGYNLSAAPDTSRQRYQELQGKKATAGMSDRELNLYFAWKEQQEKWYEEGIGNDANLSSFNNPEAPAYNSEQGSMMNVINSVLQGTMQIASFANNLQSSEVDRELVRQKAISQGLENSKQMYLLGFGYDYNNGEVNKYSSHAIGLPENSRNGKAFFKMQDTIPYLADTPFAHLTSGQIANLQSSGETCSALSGLPADKQKEFEEKVWPYVQQQMLGTVEYNPKTIQANLSERIKKLGMPDWLLKSARLRLKDLYLCLT